MQRGADAKWHRPTQGGEPCVEPGPIRRGEAIQERIELHPLIAEVTLLLCGYRRHRGCRRDLVTLIMGVVTTNPHQALERAGHVADEWLNAGAQTVHAPAARDLPTSQVDADGGPCNGASALLRRIDGPSRLGIEPVGFSPTGRGGAAATSAILRSRAVIGVAAPRTAPQDGRRWPFVFCFQPPYHTANIRFGALRVP